MIPNIFHSLLWFTIIHFQLVLTHRTKWLHHTPSGCQAKDTLSHVLPRAGALEAMRKSQRGSHETHEGILQLYIYNDIYIYIIDRYIYVYVYVYVYIYIRIYIIIYIPLKYHIAGIHHPHFIHFGGQFMRFIATDQLGPTRGPGPLGLLSPSWTTSLSPSFLRGDGEKPHEGLTEKWWKPQK
jgi:hypothetical protein